MIDFEIGVLIDRPVADVFAFISNPLNLPRWQAMVKDIKASNLNPVGVGAKYVTHTEMLGRQLEGLMEVTEYEPDTTFGFKNQAGPVNVHGVISLRPAGTGTRLNLKAHGEPGGFFKIAEGLLAGRVREMMQENLDRLKTVLEAGA